MDTAFDILSSRLSPETQDRLWREHITVRQALEDAIGETSLRTHRWIQFHAGMAGGCGDCKELIQEIRLLAERQD